MADRGARGRSSRPDSDGRRGAGADLRMRSMRSVGPRRPRAGQSAEGVRRAVLAQGGAARNPVQTQVDDDDRMVRRGLYRLRSRLRRRLLSRNLFRRREPLRHARADLPIAVPNADVALYSFPFGGTIDEAVSSAGEPYANLPNAHKFEQSNDASCSCRAPGQSWAEALANAEAKYGRHSHDILVTVEDAKRMSRPVQDPKAKPAAANAAEPGGAAPVELDINGVDTTLSAAAAAISRETSGIRDEDAQRPVSFGLKQGETVEETGPDGSTRKVRVLPATF